ACEVVEMVGPSPPQCRQAALTVRRASVLANLLLSLTLIFSVLMGPPEEWRGGTCAERPGGRPRRRPRRISRRSAAGEAAAPALRQRRARLQGAGSFQPPGSGSGASLAPHGAAQSRPAGLQRRGKRSATRSAARSGPSSHGSDGARRPRVARRKRAAGLTRES